MLIVAVARAQVQTSQQEPLCDDVKSSFCEMSMPKWQTKLTELYEEVEFVEASVAFCGVNTTFPPTSMTTSSMGSILFEDPSTYFGQKGALFMEETPTGVALKGSFAGLEPNADTHWHVFTGDCDVNGPIVAHFDVAVDTKGFADVDLELAGATLNDPALPIGGVDISGDAGRIACGSASEAVGVELESDTVNGVLIAISHCPPCHIHVNGALGGLEANSSGLLKIHTGSDCGDNVGDTFKYTSAYDPWDNVTFVADSYGHAQVSIGTEVFTVNGQYPIQGRTIVTYNSVGAAQSACGVLSTLED